MFVPKGVDGGESGEFVANIFTSALREIVPEDNSGWILINMFSSTNVHVIRLTVLSRQRHSNPRNSHELLSMVV